MNTPGNQKYGIGLSKDELKEMKWEDIKLNGAYEGDNPIKTTIDDVNGVLALYLNENKKTYKVTFMSSEKVNKNQLILFKKNLEDTFLIHFDTNKVKKNHFYKYKDELYFSYIEDSIGIDHYAFSFSMTDKELLNVDL